MVFSHTEVFLEGGGCWMFRWMDDWQSQKNHGSVVALLPRKFLQILKVFATISLLAEEFLDTLQYKISR